MGQNFKCYVTNYEEIFNKGLPFFELIKKKASKNTAIQILYIFIFYQ